MKNNEENPVNLRRVLEPDRFERRAHAIIATMAEVGVMPEPDRRESDRRRYLAQVRIRPIAQADQPHEPLTLYARDLTGDGVGFIACGELPVDKRTLVHLPGPAGRSIAAEGHVVRAQAFASGWHEGFVRFDTPVDLFSDDPARPS